MNITPLLLAGLQTMSNLLPSQERDFAAEFDAKFRQAYAAYRSGDLNGAREGIRDAEEMRPGTAVLANFRGGIFLDEGKYADAIPWLQDAVKRDPGFLPARINLADIEFRRKDYAKARTAFGVLLADRPQDEFLQYRVFLAALMENDDPVAKRLLDQIKFPGDTPAHYFAHGAWAFAHGDRSEALGWIDPGISIFGLDRSRPFAEPLEAMGWMVRGHRAPTIELANPPPSRLGW